MGAPLDVSRRVAMRWLFAPIFVQLLSKACFATESASGEIQLVNALTPILNLRDSLDILSEDIVNGTNGDVRRIVRTLQKGIDLNKAVRASVRHLPPPAREEVRSHGREAAEFLNQVVEYYDATQLKERPSKSILNFSLQAIESARNELDLVLGFFSAEVVSEARKVITASN